MKDRTNIERKLYTEHLKKFMNVDLVKIITGIRRSGKSAVLELFREDILKITDDEHVISLNFEDAEFDFITDYKVLHEYVLSKIKDDRTYYLFLDEVQDVEKWEKGVNSLRLKNIDIYITGSNSKLLSSELSTLLGGRYVQFRLHTLSFAEFINFRKEYGIGSDNIDDELDAYIRTGGFPVLSTGAFDPQTVDMIVSDINNSTILRDVVRRKKIRDIHLLQKIIDFVYDNIGNVTSASKISAHFKSERRTANFETVYNYLQYLEEALIISRVPRYDIRGRRLLETYEKYYLAEHSLQYATRRYDEKNVPGILENIVYLELLRRGYDVSIGKFDEKEVDFVADDRGKKIYVQVCYRLAGLETIEREVAPLVAIRDNYPKLVVTLDKNWQIEDRGVKGMHLKDFLLSDRW